MRSPHLAIALLAIVAACAAPDASVAQSTLEVTAGAGYTNVNAREWLTNRVVTSDHLAYGAYAQYMLRAKRPRGVQMGLRLGYANVLRYDENQGGGVILPKTANAVHAVALVRFWWHGERIYIETGPGAYRFGDFTNPVLAFGAGAAFDINDRVYVPVKARADMIFDAFTIVSPVTVAIGLGYRLGS